MRAASHSLSGPAPDQHQSETFPLIQGEFPIALLVYVASGAVPVSL